MISFFSTDSCFVFCVVLFPSCVLSLFISVCNLCVTAYLTYACSCGSIEFIAMSASIAFVCGVDCILGLYLITSFIISKGGVA
jgi:hypothetical protein